MGRLSIRKKNTAVSASRSDLRKQLHKAAQGNRDAFRSVADQYLDLITEYLVVTGYHGKERIRFYAREIFHNLWLRIAYIRRVSDFERQLFIFLKQIPVNVAPFQDLLTQKLVLLNSLQRFLVVGRDLENWTSKNLSLATRIPKYELGKPLFDAWKILVGFKTRDLDFATNACMEKVVENMEGCQNRLEQQRLCKKVKENAIASAFKADYLSLRCELVELRQNARWELAFKEVFLNEMVEDISVINPLKPDLAALLKNQVSFQYIPLEVTEAERSFAADIG
ncbi:MAG: hypothetical protein O7C75_19855 [Verrucomicrobia bacterium]|nr:hypothetical protein [Verrucomicrobiota bacterium]